MLSEQNSVTDVSILLVSRRHVGVSRQSSVNLGKTFPRISRISKITPTLPLARVCHFPEAKLYLLNGFDFSGAPNDGFLLHAFLRLSKEHFDLF